MNRENITFGTGSRTLIILMSIGAVLIIIRFIMGLGSVSNLSDAYPWGFWIGIDVLTGVALAAGGFTVAALTHIFGKEKYRAVIRPAILTAFLGYIFVALGLIVDLGRGWNIWHVIFFWNHNSAMFEVGWCVLLYLTVLALEFAPVVFEEYKMTKAQENWDTFAPWVSILLVAWFVFVMTGYPWYAGITFIILSIFYFLFRNKLPKGSTVLLLIMAGVIFSVEHQSSLGSLFLIVPTKLSALWYTPYLPLNFLISAIMVGFAMVIFESWLSSRVFGFGLEKDVIKGLVRILPFFVAATALLRFWTLYNQTGFTFAAASGAQIFFFGLEIGLGLIIPFVLLVIPGTANSSNTSFLAATLIVLGVLFNRVNVSIVGISVPERGIYIPAIWEVLISVGIISTGIMLYYIMCSKLPVFEKR